MIGCNYFILYLFFNYGICYWCFYRSSFKCFLRFNAGFSISIIISIIISISISISAGFGMLIGIIIGSVIDYENKKESR